MTEKEAAALLREQLHGAFAWDATQEGFDFWHEVSLRLDRIARHGLAYRDPAACKIEFRPSWTPHPTTVRVTDHWE